MRKFVWILSLLPVLAIGIGCKSVLPSDYSIARSQWKSFEEARSSFERLIPHQTSVQEMIAYGYDPEATPNLKTLTYVDVINRFLPNSSLRVEDLHEAIQTCLREKEKCRAYELDLNIVKGDRYGNVAADIFGFKKKTKVTGWNFKGLIITEKDQVIYTLWSGQPSVNRLEQKRKPLGPLQDLEGVLGKAASSAM